MSFHSYMKSLGRYRLITDRANGDDYLHRYYLLFKDRMTFPFNFLLHKIVKSDIPIFHDHPWDYITIILRGGYFEHLPVFDEDGKLISETVTWRGPGSIIRRKAPEYHWLELKDNVPAVTLFIPMQRKRMWGFLKYDTTINDHKWIPYTEYVES